MWKFLPGALYSGLQSYDQQQQLKSALASQQNARALQQLQLKYLPAIYQAQARKAAQPPAADTTIISTPKGIYSYNKTTGQSTLLTDPKGNPLMPVSKNVNVNMGQWGVDAQGNYVPMSQAGAPDAGGAQTSVQAQAPAPSSGATTVTPPSRSTPGQVTHTTPVHTPEQAAAVAHAHQAISRAIGSQPDAFGQFSPPNINYKDLMSLLTGTPAPQAAPSIDTTQAPSVDSMVSPDTTGAFSGAPASFDTGAPSVSRGASDTDSGADSSGDTSGDAGIGPSDGTTSDMQDTSSDSGGDGTGAPSISYSDLSDYQPQATTAPTAGGITPIIQTAASVSSRRSGAGKVLYNPATGQTHMIATTPVATKAQNSLLADAMLKPLTIEYYRKIAPLIALRHSGHRGLLELQSMITGKPSSALGDYESAIKGMTPNQAEAMLKAQGFDMGAENAKTASKQFLPQWNDNKYTFAQRMANAIVDAAVRSNNFRSFLKSGISLDNVSPAEKEYLIESAQKKLTNELVASLQNRKDGKVEIVFPDGKGAEKTGLIPVSQLNNIIKHPEIRVY